MVSTFASPECDFDKGWEMAFEERDFFAPPDDWEPVHGLVVIF